MARVKVCYRAALEDKIGKKEETIEAATVREVLAYLKKTYGKEISSEAKRMLIAVNNDSIQLHKGLDTKLYEGMIVRFLPICGGG